MRTEAMRLAEQIITEMESELGTIPFNAKIMMIANCAKEVSLSMDLGFRIFRANFFEESEKKRFMKDYKLF